MPATPCGNHFILFAIMVALVSASAPGTAWGQSAERLVELERAREAAARESGATPTVPDEKPAKVEPLTDRQAAIHVLNRLGFGPRPGEVEKVVQLGWRTWVEQQLDPASIDDSALEARLGKEYPSLKLSMSQTFARYRPPYKNSPPTEEEMRQRNRLNYQVRRELTDSVLVRAVESERRFQEVIVDFWRNHFNVDQSKDDVNYLANHYEEHVIRAHAFGHFGQMLLASAKHPAMLIYLDNAISQRPPTEHEQKLFDRYDGKDHVPFSVRAKMRQRGLNENYAREVLELHTFGVRQENQPGGYYQYDIVELARVLTGWSVGYTDGQYGFRFNSSYHDPFKKRVLGTAINAGGGVEDGERVLVQLSIHPHTADFIAWKLCRYLLRDDPPDDMVREASLAFRRTNGHLPTVYRAIVLHDAFVSRDYFAVKFKTPLEFTVSALRAVDADIRDLDETQRAMDHMGQPLYRMDDPTGYYDQAEAWMDPGVLIYRWDYALKLAAGRVKGISIGSAFTKGFDGLDPQAIRSRLEREVLGDQVRPATRKVLDEITRSGLRGQELAARLLGVMLGSPEFQQQ